MINHGSNSLEKQGGNVFFNPGIQTAMTSRQNRENRSGPIVFALFARLLPVINLLAIGVLAFGTFFQWNVREESRAKVTVWLAAISATVVIQSLAGTISNATIEDGTIVISTRWRRYSIPLDAITGVEPFNLGIQGLRFVRIRFSELSAINDAIICVDSEMTADSFIYGIEFRPGDEKSLGCESSPN